MMMPPLIYCQKTPHYVQCFFSLTQYAFDDELDVLLTEGMPVQGLGLIWPDWATQLLGE